MKKILFIIGTFVLVGSSNGFAQGGGKGTGKVKFDDFHFSAALKEGQNTVTLNKRGQGTVVFTKSGNTFSNMRYLDSAGKSHIMSPLRPGSDGAPKPECKYPIPDACFGTADKNIGLCICKPTDLSSGDNTYHVAVKKRAHKEILVVGSPGPKY